MQKFTKTLDKSDLKSEAEHKGKKAPIRKSEDISKMMEDITAVMGCYSSSDMTGIVKNIVLHIGGALDSDGLRTTGESEYGGRKRAMSQQHQKSPKQHSGVHLKRHSTKGVKLRLLHSKSESPSADSTSTSPKNNSERPFKIRFSADETSDAMIHAKEHILKHDVTKNTTEKSSKNLSDTRDAHSRDSGVFSATPNSVDESSVVSQAAASQSSMLQSIDDDDSTQKFLMPKTFDCTIDLKGKDEVRTGRLPSRQSKSVDKHFADLKTTTTTTKNDTKGSCKR